MSGVQLSFKWYPNLCSYTPLFHRHLSILHAETGASDIKKGLSAAKLITKTIFLIVILNTFSL